MGAFGRPAAGGGALMQQNLQQPNDRWSWNLMAVAIATAEEAGERGSRSAGPWR